MVDPVVLYHDVLVVVELDDEVTRELRESPAVCVAGLVGEEELPKTLVVGEVESRENLDKVAIVSREHQVFQASVVPGDDSVQGVDPVGENVVVGDIVEGHVVREQVGSHVVQETHVVPELRLDGEVRGEWPSVVEIALEDAPDLVDLPEGEEGDIQHGLDFLDGGLEHRPVLENLGEILDDILESVDKDIWTLVQAVDDRVLGSRVRVYGDRVLSVRKSKVSEILVGDSFVGW